MSSPQQRGQWLLAALRNGRLKRAEDLIREGAGLAVRSADGETALYTALAHGHYEMVPVLLERGADPNVPGPRGTYPIHMAAAWGGEDAPALLEALLRHGARLEVGDDEGATAMFLAGKVGTAETIRTLLRHGANISDRNQELDTALTFACCWGMAERAALLLDLGIDVHARDDSGMTALSWASRGGHAGTIALLLRRGARVDVADCWGRTPLIYAAGHGSARCVALLLEAGADARIRDESGQTALDHARRYAGRDLEQTLLAQVTGGQCWPVPEPEQLFIERGLTPEGEPTICVGVRCGNGARTVEKTDGFDAVVRLLEQALAAADPV